LYEWLRGFAEAESTFQNLEQKDRPFNFRFCFKIKLHKDDRALLVYLAESLTNRYSLP